MDDVAEPLLGDLVDLPLVGQVTKGLRVSLEELPDLREGELLILRHLDPSHFAALDILKSYVI